MNRFSHRPLAVHLVLMAILWTSIVPTSAVFARDPDEDLYRDQPRRTATPPARRQSLKDEQSSVNAAIQKQKEDLKKHAEGKKGIVSAPEGTSGFDSHIKSITETSWLADPHTRWKLLFLAATDIAAFVAFRHYFNANARHTYGHMKKSAIEGTKELRELRAEVKEFNRSVDEVLKVADNVIRQAVRQYFNENPEAVQSQWAQKKLKLWTQQLDADAEALAKTVERPASGDIVKKGWDLYERLQRRSEIDAAKMQGAGNKQAKPMPESTVLRAQVREAVSRVGVSLIAEASDAETAAPKAKAPAHAELVELIRTSDVLGKEFADHRLNTYEHAVREANRINRGNFPEWRKNWWSNLKGRKLPKLSQNTIFWSLTVFAIVVPSAIVTAIDYSHFQASKAQREHEDLVAAGERRADVTPELMIELVGDGLLPNVEEAWRRVQRYGGEDRDAIALNATFENEFTKEDSTNARSADEKQLALVLKLQRAMKGEVFLKREPKTREELYREFYAILLADDPNLKTLAEYSDERKAPFLKQLARETIAASRRELQRVENPFGEGFGPGFDKSRSPMKVPGKNEALDGTDDKPELEKEGVEPEEKKAEPIESKDGAKPAPATEPAPEAKKEDAESADDDSELDE